MAPGPACRALESAFASHILADSSFEAHAVQSGTAALTLLLAGLSETRVAQHEVVTSPLACAALVHAIRDAGAVPVFVDAKADGNLDPEQAIRVRSSQTLAFLVPHLYGQPAAVGPLVETGVPVIEDCAQTLGIDTSHGRVGTSGTAMMTSFYATKPITSGQGGLVASRDKPLIEWVRDACEYDNRDDGRRRWNSSLSDWNAQLAIPQVIAFADSLAARRGIAGTYHQAFSRFGPALALPNRGEIDGHGWFRYVLLVPENSDPWIVELNRRGVEAKRPVYGLLSRQFGFGGDYPVAMDHWKRTLSLPIYPTLSEPERQFVLESVSATADKLL